MGRYFDILGLTFIEKTSHNSFFDYLIQKDAISYFNIWKKIDSMKNQLDNEIHENLVKIYKEYLTDENILGEFRTEGILNLIGDNLSKFVLLENPSKNELGLGMSIVEMIKSDCSDILHKYGRDFISQSKFISFLYEEKQIKIEILVIFDDQKKANLSMNINHRTQIKSLLKSITKKLGLEDRDEFSLRKLNRDDVFEDNDRRTVVYQSSWLEKDQTLKKCKIVDGERLICIQRKSVFNLTIQIPSFYKKIEYECNTMTLVKSLVSTIISKEKSTNIGAYGLLNYSVPKSITEPQKGENKKPFTLKRSVSVVKLKKNSFSSSQSEIDIPPQNNKDFPWLNKEQKLHLNLSEIKRNVFVVCTKEEFLRNRFDFWIHVQCDWENSINHKRVLIKKMVRKGIPYFMREKIWPLMLGANLLVDKNPGLYDEYLQKQMDLGDREDIDRLVILKDINRTFPKHKFFSKEKGTGQTQLRNVLEAFHYSNKDVGYCQGMNFITGILLLHMPEEESFWCLDQLINDKLNLLDMFCKNLPLLTECVYRFKLIMKLTVPLIVEKFEKNEINCNVFGMGWFHCLFSQKFPLNLVVRIWDILFYERDFSIIFRVAIALLKVNFEKIFENEDILLNLLNIHVYCDNVDSIISAALKISKIPEMCVFKGTKYFTDNKDLISFALPKVRSSPGSILYRARTSIRDLGEKIKHRNSNEK